MALSNQQFTSTGSEDHVILSIPYLQRGDIKLYFDGVEQNFTWASDTRINFTPAPIGVEVVVLRRTNRERLVYLLQEGAPFTRNILDQIHLQLLYLEQEGYEGGVADIYGDLDMHGFRVRGAGDPTSAKDYTTKEWVEGRILDAVLGGSDLAQGIKAQIMAALTRSYAIAGYNVVGAFQSGFNITSTTDVGIDLNTGKAYTGPVGYVPANTDPTTGPFTDVSTVGVAFTGAQVQQLLDAGFTTVHGYIHTLSTPVVIPRNATVIFNGLTRLNMNGDVFTIVTGSRVYGDFVIGAGFSPTVGHVDGTYRPTMLLADNRRAGVYGTIRSENPTPLGRALFLDGNARNGKRGIISWFECDITLRNVARACDVEASNPTHIDGAKSYVNNNYLRIAMWDVPHGYIEADVDTTKAEIAANTVHIDYQSSAVSVQPVRNRGVRNVLSGNVWDTDRVAYPSLLSNAVDIGGSGNIVGGPNWPSPTSNVVVISDPLCKYVGFTYGTAKSISKHLNVFSRLGVDQGNGVEAAVVGQLGSVGAAIPVPAGSVLKSVFSRTYGFSSNRAPYYIDGYILLKNPTLNPVTVQVKFGPTASDGGSSTTFQVPAERVRRVDLAMMLAVTRQSITCGDGSWYGTIDYTAASAHQVHIQITSVEGVVVDGVVLRRSAEL